MVRSVDDERQVEPGEHAGQPVEALDPHPHAHPARPRHTLDGRDTTGEARQHQLDSALDPQPDLWRYRDAAERRLRGTTTSLGDHVEALVGCVRSALCLSTGDLDGTRRALGDAYAAARRTRDLPVVSRVAVGVAALLVARGEHRRAAALLGVAARLRGADDRTDRHVQELARRGRESVGEVAFAAAHETGRRLDGMTAVDEADPALLPDGTGAAQVDPLGPGEARSGG